MHLVSIQFIKKIKRNIFSTKDRSLYSPPPIPQMVDTLMQRPLKASKSIFDRNPVCTACKVVIKALYGLIRSGVTIEDSFKILTKFCATFVYRQPGVCSPLVRKRRVSLLGESTITVGGRKQANYRRAVEVSDEPRHSTSQAKLNQEAS